MSTIQSKGIFLSLAAQLDKLALGTPTGKAAFAPRSATMRRVNGSVLTSPQNTICKSWKTSAASIW